MLAKKFILLIIVVGLVVGGFFAASTFTSKSIETVSAKIVIDTEEVSANTTGILKTITVEPYQLVKEGDIIATISQTEHLNCKPPKNKNDKKAAENYENAAIMYKDGIITKEQYDASLKEYRQYKQAKTCIGDTIEKFQNVYALTSGKIELNDQLNIGDKVYADTIIAYTQKSTPKVIAYFSPKEKRQLKIGRKAELSIIKYPEKVFTGTISAKDKIDLYGLAVKLDINEDVSSLNLKNGDAVIVKIVK